MGSERGFVELCFCYAFEGFRGQIMSYLRVCFRGQRFRGHWADKQINK